MIPFSSGLRTDSTMIRYGRHWGRLKRAILARFGWRPRPVGATPMATSLIKCCDRCFDKSLAGDHKTTSNFFATFVSNQAKPEAARLYLFFSNTAVSLAL
ncbi:hypothetical protein [Desulforamulus hydrothermalis]|uniref:hypothetical protein n=1 Tax=Desulforamulus hydrothermalis TaxID=412895 RepID=UPI001390AEC3|nr:hypothetical protein [Desulforamulus hydrothermalis]